MDKFRKSFWMTGLTMLITSGAIYAQNSTPSVSPAATPTTAPAAPVTVTPEMRAAIKELLDTSKFRDSLSQTYQGLVPSLPAQMAQMLNSEIQKNQKLSEDQKKQVRERLNKSFDAAAKSGIAILQDPKMVDEIVEKVYPIYAKYFTLAEIKQLTAFYKSPVGAKSITTMPLVVGDTMRSTMTLLQGRISPILDNLLKKEVDAVQGK